MQQFTAQLLRTRSLEAKAKQRIAATENTLNGLLGRYPQPVPRGVALTAQTVPTSVSAGLPAAMLLRRPDVQQAERQLTAARRQQFLLLIDLYRALGGGWTAAR